MGTAVVSNVVARSPHQILEPPPHAQRFPPFRSYSIIKGQIVPLELLRAARVPVIIPSTVFNFFIWILGCGRGAGYEVWLGL